MLITSRISLAGLLVLGLMSCASPTTPAETVLKKVTGSTIRVIETVEGPRGVDAVVAVDGEQPLARQLALSSMNSSPVAINSDPRPCQRLSAISQLTPSATCTETQVVAEEIRERGSGGQLNAYETSDLSAGDGEALRRGLITVICS